ncbi:MAG: PDZ domain-containing protein [Pirellulaceae bacterium]|jgi:S1-C subfamily serine protease
METFFRSMPSLAPHPLRGVVWAVAKLLHLLWFVAGLPMATWAQDAGSQALQQAVAKAVEQTCPSVLRVEVFAGSTGLEGDETGATSALTTATVLSSDGWLVASRFSAPATAGAISVITADGTRLAVQKRVEDVHRELIYLKIEPPQPLTAVTPGDVGAARVGQTVIALGKTFASDRCSVSAGILSAKGRVYEKAIQCDAKISPTNYGGPLIDLDGRVLGVLTPIRPGIATEGETAQWYDSGIGFAIPIDQVLAKLPVVQAGTTILPGKLGIRPKSDDPFTGPVVVAGVAPGSPAIAAGLKAGDEIVEVNQKPITRWNQMQHAMGSLDAGDTVAIAVRRDGERVELKAELAAKIPPYREPFLGLILHPIEDPKGMKIDAVVPGSPADQAGLKVGGTITQVSGAPVDSWERWRESILFRELGEPIAMAWLLDGTAMPDVSIQAINLMEARKLKYPELQANPKDPNSTGAVETITLGDLPNKAFYYQPNTYAADGTQGLVLVIPEPGEPDRKAWVDRWERFSRQQGWIVAVVGSSDAKQWTPDDLEAVDRTLTQLLQKHPIDRRRTVIGGVGSGGSLASLIAVQQRQRVGGYWGVQSRLPPMMAEIASEPLTLHRFYLIGDRPEFPKLVELWGAAGLDATHVATEVPKENLSDAPVWEALQQWLQWMGCD